MPWVNTINLFSGGCSFYLALKVVRRIQLLAPTGFRLNITKTTRCDSTHSWRLQNMVTTRRRSRTLSLRYRQRMNEVTVFVEIGHCSLKGRATVRDTWHSSHPHNRSKRPKKIDEKFKGKHTLMDRPARSKDFQNISKTSRIR